MGGQILLVNSLMSCGIQGVTSMAPILMNMGYRLSNLPTSLISNPTSLGETEILDTTSYVEHTVQAWNKNVMSFDAIVTGYLSSVRQILAVIELCRQVAKTGSNVIVDPTLASGRRLYGPMSDGQLFAVRKLVHIADLCIPTYDDACLLSGLRRYQGELTPTGATRLTRSLLRLGAKAIIITNVNVEGRYVCVGYDDELESSISFEFPIKQQPPRSAHDIFVATLIGRWLAGRSLEASAYAALEAVATLCRKGIQAEAMRGGSRSR